MCECFSLMFLYPLQLCVCLCVNVKEEILLSGWMTSVVSTIQEVMRGIKQTHTLIESHATAGWLVLAGGLGIKEGVCGITMSNLYT